MDVDIRFEMTLMIGESEVEIDVVVVLIISSEKVKKRSFYRVSFIYTRHFLIIQLNVNEIEYFQINRKDCRESDHLQSTR